jgi:hypothetical protein
MGQEQLCDGGPAVATERPPPDHGHLTLSVGALSHGDLLRFQAFNGKAIKSVQDGNPGGALPLLEEALSVLRYPAVLSNYGDALARCGRLDDAMAAFDEAIAKSPEYAQAHYNRGVVLDQLDRWEEGRESYKRSIKYRVTGAACNNCANDCQYTLQLADAVKYYRMAIKHGWADARWNMSLALMMQGKWSEGWDFYHWRPQMAAYREHEALWRGEDLSGKTLVVLTEQGLGDSIYALRFIPVLRKMGLKSLVIACENTLMRVVQAMCPKDPLLCDVTIINRENLQWNQPFHYVTLAMSIPGYLSPDDVGPRAPYLKATGVKQQGVLTVGLCWNGSTVVGPPKERNIPLAMLKPLSEIPGVKLISLQKGNAVDEMAECGFAIADAMAGAKDVYDTACVIASCDLVITVDTLIPHMGGALGVPTWLMNRYMSCWQWGTPDYDPVLYETVAQFRQEAPREWESVVQRITYGLQRIAADAHTLGYVRKEETENPKPEESP